MSHCHKYQFHYITHHLFYQVKKIIFNKKKIYIHRIQILRRREEIGLK